MPTIKNIDVQTAHDWLKNDEAVLVDVREPGEYDLMHIAGARLIPVGIINHDILPELQSRKLIIHCQLGKRGGMACEKLLQDNPALEVYNLEGGIIAWDNAGLKVEKT